MKLESYLLYLQVLGSGFYPEHSLWLFYKYQTGKFAQSINPAIYFEMEFVSSPKNRKRENMPKVIIVNPKANRKEALLKIFNNIVHDYL
jgi:hypothetical protein